MSPSQEQREALGEGVKDLLAGKMLVDQGLKRNIKFIVLGVISCSVTHSLRRELTRRRGVQ